MERISTMILIFLTSKINIYEGGLWLISNGKNIN